MNTPTSPLGDRHSGASEHMNAPARLLNAVEAAELLAVPPSWILAEARAERIPFVKLGRYVRFEAAELEAWWRLRSRGPWRRRRRPGSQPGASDAGATV